MKTLAIVSALLLSLTACTNTTATPSTQSAEQHAPKTQGIWIDVRSAEEYQAGHIQGSQNVSFGKIGEQITNIAPDKNTPIHLYCQSGRRAEIARKTLTELGYTNVTNHGAYDELVKKDKH